MPSYSKLQILPNTACVDDNNNDAYLRDTEKNAYYNRLNLLVAKFLIPLLNRQDRQHNRNFITSRLA